MFKAHLLLRLVLRVCTSGRMGMVPSLSGMGGPSCPPPCVDAHRAVPQDVLRLPDCVVLVLQVHCHGAYLE